MTVFLSSVFFLSGVAGVLFETLWFRLLGLTLGNGFEASGLVLASFMGGLAAGSALAAALAQRIRTPLRLYVLAEGLAGVVGLGAVLALPVLNAPLARLFTALGPHASAINLVRWLTASLVLLLPTTMMGLTLPLLCQAAQTPGRSLGAVLGRLYGWNTLGGVLGALAGELWLIPALGQRGTGGVAALLELLAAGLVFLRLRRAHESAARADTATRQGAPAAAGAEGGAPPTSSRWSSARWLAAAFLAGASLLALEAIWFRFLQLFVFGTHLIFAVMLAVVLLAIGVGGVLASVVLRRFPSAHRATPLVAGAAAASVPLTYALFDPLVGGNVFTTADTLGAVGLFLRLMLPTSLLSGALFTLIGAERGEREQPLEAVGKLTLANTLGAMAGALVAGFVLLPGVGVEKALFVATASYGLIALLTLVVPRGAWWRRAVGGVLVASTLVGTVVFFPFGLFETRFIPRVIERYREGKPTLVALREGRTETAMYLRESLRGRPVHHRLMTNGHSMSATTFRGRRYMKLYAYWAMAVAPRAERALLISYGVGTTAKALTDTRQLRSIDVVDISRDILDLAPVAFPGEASPLADPRVRVHVEDGRFFLQTTAQSFDLITGEPPPLRGAGVTNLYSREYFELVRARLNEGGVVTYWLPVNQLSSAESKSIMRAFCDVFEDCTLWNGAGLQWMLAGTRGVRNAVSEEAFTAQWRDPLVAPELAALGFDDPSSLGSTFLADADTLRAWTEGVAPLDDDHPARIGHHYPSDPLGDPLYRTWMEPKAVKARFEESAFVRAVWPPALRSRTAEAFAEQAILDDFCAFGSLDALATLSTLLDTSTSKTLLLLLMGTEPARQAVALSFWERGERGSDLAFEAGAHALAERRYEEAVAHFDAVIAGPSVSARLLRLLALIKLGRLEEARRAVGTFDYRRATPKEFRSLAWLKSTLNP